MTVLPPDPPRLLTCGGFPQTLRWRIDSHFLFTFEAPLAALERVVPPTVDPVEVRPGVGLLSVGCLRFFADQLAPAAPPFHEVVVAVQIAPDLGVDMPMPRFTFWALAVASDSAAFVAREERLTFTPAVHVPSLRVHFSDDNREATAADARGPILTLRNSHPEPRYTPGEFWGQHANGGAGQGGGRPHRGIWQWEGSRFEHMRAGDAGILHPHPFWGALEVSGIRRIYRAMVSERGVEARERFYAMWPEP